MLSAAEQPPSSAGVGARAIQVAQNTFEIVEWPVQDLAAVIGWDVAALTGLLFGVKLLAMGWAGEKRRVRHR